MSSKTSKKVMKVICHIPKTLEWTMSVHLSEVKRKSINQQLLYIIRTLPDHRSETGKAYYESKKDHILHHFQSSVNLRPIVDMRVCVVTIEEPHFQQAIISRALLLGLEEGQFLSFLACVFAQGSLEKMWGIVFK